MNTLTKPQRHWLADRLLVQKLKPRSFLFQPSTPATELYFIISGKMRVEASSADGELLIKRICSDGDFLGLKGLTGQVQHLEAARTMRSGALMLSFSKTDVQRLVEVNFKFGNELLLLLGSEIRFYEERAMSILESSAKQRFTNFVVEMAQQNSVRKGDEWMFNSELTQAEIGYYIGTGRQTITEILNHLEKNGLLRYDWGRFYVKDLERLAGWNGGI